MGLLEHRHLNQLQLALIVPFGRELQEDKMETPSPSQPQPPTPLPPPDPDPMGPSQP